MKKKSLTPTRNEILNSNSRKNRFLQTILVFTTILVLLISNNALQAQCLNYSVPLDTRVNLAKYIIQGTVIEKECYEDDITHNIYTRNRVVVNAWLKGESSIQELYVITAGGQLGMRLTIVNPSLQLQTGSEYILILDGAKVSSEDRKFRAANPTAMQLVTVADAQGALIKQNDLYYDLLAEPARDEAATFGIIRKITGSSIVTPQGKLFAPRVSNALQKLGASITSFSPTTVNSGTLLSNNQITILGSGFGSTQGAVYFSNANDGGATKITSGLTSDIISWSDTSITVKVPTKAGTGIISVNGTINSATELTVGYAHLSIESSSMNFSSNTRQRYYLRNLDGTGGYTFKYNTTSGFSGNVDAIAAFERALTTWRCSVGINFKSGGTTTATKNGQDGINSVAFNSNLPLGILGQATSTFSGSGITSFCDQFNTVWWASDIDVEYANPPYTNFTWQFGPAAPASSQFDFESVTVHELGHALGLGHRIAVGEVMNYSLSNGATVRTPSAIEFIGASDKLAYSSAPTCFNPPNSGTPIITALTTVGTASSAPSVCINTALTAITHATTGATGIGTATGLPAGITATWSANVITISGTPTASGVFNYSIPLTGGCGSANATGTITVTAANTVGTASSTPTLCIYTLLTTITHTTTGATGIGTATGLPAGVTAAWSANVITISGTPTASGIFNYSIPLTGGCVSANATGTITVTALTTVGPASSSPSICINTALTAITHAATGATGIGTATGLPAGVTAAWSANVITISGTPTASGTFNYSIPLTGGCGASIVATSAIQVNGTNTIALTSVSTSTNQTYCLGNAIIPITYATTVATGAIFSGLPAGVSGNWTNNVVTISGTPTVAGIYNYTVTLTGG